MAARLAMCGLIVAVAWLGPAPSSALAQESDAVVPSGAAEDGADTRKVDIAELTKTRQEALRYTPMTQRIGRYLTAAGKEMEAGEFDEAKRLLRRLNMDRLNPFEAAVVYQLIAVIDYQTGNQAEALESFELAIDQQALPLDREVKVMFNVVQLHAAQQQWPEVLQKLDRWEQFVPEPTGISLYLRAAAHFQMDEYEEALVAAERAVATSDEPDESWLQMLAALYVLQEDYDAVTPVLEQLVMRFPKKAYWVQLSLIYGARDAYPESLAVQQLAYVQGLLTEDRELQRLARSYVFSGLPFQAAHVLTDGLGSGTIEPGAKVYELLANSWIQAREYDKSIEPLQKAAELADNGDLYVRLGQVQMAKEEWGEAASFFQKAIEKGDLKNPGSAELLLGIALYNDDRVGPARFKFERARKYDRTRKAANDWLRHIEREVQSG